MASSFFEQESPSDYFLQQYRRKEHKARLQKSKHLMADLKKIVEEEKEDGEKLKEECLSTSSGRYGDDKWEK